MKKGVLRENDSFLSGLNRLIFMAENLKLLLGRPSLRGASFARCPSQAMSLVGDQPDMSAVTKPWCQMWCRADIIVYGWVKYLPNAVQAARPLCSSPWPGRSPWRFLCLSWRPCGQSRRRPRSACRNRARRSRVPLPCAPHAWRPQSAIRSPAAKELMVSVTKRPGDTTPAQHTPDPKKTNGRWWFQPSFEQKHAHQNGSIFPKFAE